MDTTSISNSDEKYPSSKLLHNVNSSLSSHIIDAARHINSSERTTWNNKLSALTAQSVVLPSSLNWGNQYHFTPNIHGTFSLPTPSNLESTVKTCDLILSFTDTVYPISFVGNIQWLKELPTFEPNKTYYLSFLTQGNSANIFGVWGGSV